MWTAFPSPDYYAGSAPSDANSRRRACPPAPITNAGRATPDGSHVHHQTAQRRRRPAIPLRHRHAYPAALRRGLPAGDMNRPRSRPPPTAGVHRDPAHIRQVRAGGILRGVRTLVSHVHLSVSLAGPEPSGSAGPSRRCRGCLPPSPAPPGSGCPQLHQAAATAQRRSPFISARSHGASWRSMSSCQSRRGRSTPKKPGRLRRSSGRRRWISFRSRITRNTRLRLTATPSRRRTNALELVGRRAVAT
jgi:hypothetical protein